MKAFGPVGSGNGRLRVQAAAWSAGTDWVVMVQGGEAPHVGAMALACPCDGAARVSGAVDCYASVVSVPGHRDDVLARDLALKLCRGLRVPIALSVGIHIDFAEQAELTQLIQNAEAAVYGLLTLLHNKE